MATAALAAEQGTPGATSTGSLTINLKINHNVRITGLDDLDLTFVEDDDITGSEAFCVNDNLSAEERGYSVKATSANGDGTNFVLVSDTDSVVYDVQFDDDNDAEVGGTDLDNDDPNGEFDSGAATNMGADCTSENASIFVTINKDDHQDAEAGDYSDVLTLLITAD